MLVQDIFIAAMEIIGATTLDELPEPSEMQKCLRHCNLMLDSWASRLSLQATIQESVPLQAGKAVYTIGPGGDFRERLFALGVSFQQFGDLRPRLGRQVLLRNQRCQAMALAAPRPAVR